jgi:uncharacterized protein YkwD
MKRAISGLFLTCLSCLSAPAAETTVEKYDDGTPRRKFAVDADGRKDGPYTEYFPDGKVKVKATYKAGRLHGTLTQYVAGKAVLTQPFQDGKLVHPKSLEEIRKKLKEILLPPKEKAKDRLTAESQAALRRVQAFRYLVDLPYDNLVLDDESTAAAQAAARICNQLRQLNHTPPNPGWPEDEYKLAYKGASHSNLAYSSNPSLAQAVIEWIWDSDGNSLEQLGHRRWIFNPALRKVGFGKAGSARMGYFTAMFAWDRSQPKVPDYRFVSYPARGLMPLEFFRSTAAWSVSLNPRVFRKPDDSVQPKIYAVDGELNQKGEPLKLNFAKVNTMGFGIPYCLIFRPGKAAVGPGKRYVVEINDLKRTDGTAAVVRFVVEFVRVN